MEFLGGILFTLIALFFGYKIDQALKKRKARAEYVRPSGATRRTPTDYPDRNQP